MSIASSRYKKPPRTAMEVFEMLPEGSLAEVINNVIYMSPAPLFNHQDVLSDLHYYYELLHKRKEVRKMFISPLDVFFDGRNALQPDICLYK